MGAYVSVRRARRSWSWCRLHLALSSSRKGPAMWHVEHHHASFGTPAQPQHLVLRTLVCGGICGGIWWYAVVCGGMWYAVVCASKCSGTLVNAVVCGGMWWYVVVYGGMWWYTRALHADDGRDRVVPCSSRVARVAPVSSRVAPVSLPCRSRVAPVSRC